LKKFLTFFASSLTSTQWRGKKLFHARGEGIKNSCMIYCPMEIFPIFFGWASRETFYNGVRIASIKEIKSGWETSKLPHFILCSIIFARGWEKLNFNLKKFFLKKVLTGSKIKLKNIFCF
jgi:hypothetical protein